MIEHALTITFAAVGFIACCGWLFASQRAACLDAYVSDLRLERDTLRSECDRLLGKIYAYAKAEDRRQKQRVAASQAAARKRRAQSEERRAKAEAERADAAERTIKAFQNTRLAPRDEVVASVRNRRQAQA